MGLETDQLAWVVLQTANRTQTKGSTVRLLVPRAAEVIDEMGIEPADERMVAVENYLLEQGYVAPVDIGLSRSAYTITPAGLSWLKDRPPMLLEVLERAVSDVERLDTGLLSRGRRAAQEPAERLSWWRRFLGV
jgi:hypothetical protein